MYWRWIRLVVAAIAVAVPGLLLALLSRIGPDASFWPKCVFHQVTGLNCPGCGATRATYALMQGEWSVALRDNVLAILLLPLCGLVGAWELAGWVRGKPLPGRIYLGRRVGWGLLAMVLSFWVLRNIPCWPLTLLSPL